RRRPARIGEVAGRPQRTERGQDLAAQVGRMEEEVALRDVRRPLALAREDARLRQRMLEGSRRTADKQDDRLVTTCYLVEDGGVGGVTGHADERVHRRQVRADDSRYGSLVRGRDV